MPDGGATERLGEVGQDLRGPLLRKRSDPAEVRLVDRVEAFVAVDRTPGSRYARGSLLPPHPEELDDPGEQSVNLLARVVAVYEKEVTPQGQETKTILSGILGDATATVPFTAWEPLPTPLAKGDVIRVQNAYTKEYRGQVQLNFGVRT